MKKIGIIFVSVGIVFLLSACGVNLQENEASKIINEHFGFPKPVMSYLSGNANTDIGQGIIKIIQTTGYVVHNPEASGGSVSAALATDFLPTEKGKGIIDGIDHNGFYDSYTYRGSVVSESLDSIKEILIDKETKTAIVKFTTKYEPIEPLYSSVCINERCQFFGDQISKNPERKIELKKYDKGWRFPE